MSDRPDSSPEVTLRHFLKLSLAQIESRIKSKGSMKFDADLRRMRLLEELIKEQLPDENTRSATGASR